MSKQHTFTFYIEKIECGNNTIAYYASTSCVGPYLIHFNDEEKTRIEFINLIVASHVMNPNLFPLDDLLRLLGEYSQKYQSIGKIRRIGDKTYNVKHVRLIAPMEPKEIRFFARVLESIDRIGY